MLLIVENTWVLLMPVVKRLEGVHVRILIQVKKLMAKRLNDRSWRKVAADRLLQRLGTQPLHI